MQSNVTDQKCPSCRAPLRYSPKTKGWDCEYCKSHFTLEELKKKRKQKEKRQNKEMNSAGYTCKNCGANIIVSENTSATSCIYCKSTAILENRLENELTPSAIIPFIKTKEEAIEAFQKMGFRKWFVPKEFTNKKNIQEIQGIYIPFWLFDFLLETKISGKGKRISTWCSGEYQYTKTDTFRFEREGNFPFYDVPVDGSKHFDDALMNSIEPFEYKSLVDFDSAYLSGFLAEKYDLTKEEVQNIAIDRAENTAINRLESSLSYTTKTIEDKVVNPLNLEGEYVLLPVWLLNIKYKDKVYPYAMNGQTGKMIGNIPTQKSKVISFFFFLALILSLITILLFMWIGGYVL